MTGPLFYFPERHGALCDQCYLRDKRDGHPVGPEMNKETNVIVVGEAPGGTEVEEGRPFVGKSGWELSTGLAVHGIRRSHVSYTNALACHPPDDNLDMILHKLQRENKKRERENVRLQAENGPDARLLPILPSPFDCCRPRLLKDLEGFTNVIAVGKRGSEAVLGHPVSIMEMRGGPVEQDGRKVMPTLHPAFILRMRRWTRAFRADLGRAFRWFRGESGWRQPKITYNPSPAALRAFLTPARAYAYDTETKSPLPGRPELAKDPLHARLGLLGIATDDEVMVVSFLGVNGSSTFYSDAEINELKDILREFFTNPHKLKIDFNGYYDVPIIRRHIGVVPWPRLDNILQHRDVEPELPHGLGYVGSIYTEIPYAWKVDHSGTDAESDDEWRLYNAIDCVLTHRVSYPLAEAITLRNQGVPLSMHHAVQRICIGLHQNGVWVNQPRRAEWDVKLRIEAIEHLRGIKDDLNVAGLASEYIRDFNPGSVEQLKDLFFNRWSMTPVEFSKKTGEPSTGDETIREFLRDPKLPAAQRNFLARLRRFRATTKRRGVVRRLVSFREMVPKDPLSVDEEDEETTRDEAIARKVRVTRRKKGAKSDSYGLVHDDQRVHSNFNAHSVATGWRTSSNEPNMQNTERRLRQIFAPHGCPLEPMLEWVKAGHWRFSDGSPFRVFMYADQDQGEMRIVAALAGATRLLEAFKQRKDPHALNATDFFGDIFEKSTGKDWDRLRDFSKCVVGGTRVAVPGRGLVRIVELAKALPKPGDYSNLSVQTIGFDGKKHAATKFYNAGKQRTIRVKTESGYMVEGTGKHRLRLANGKWIRLDAIKAGDALQLANTKGCFAREYVEVPVNPWVVKLTPLSRTTFDHFAAGLPTVKIDEKWGYLLGALQGDGCVKRAPSGFANYVSLIGLPSDGIVERVTDLFKHFGLSPYIQKTFRKGGAKPRQLLDEVTVGSRAFAGFLYRIGFAKDGLGRKVGPRTYEQDPLKVARVPDLVFRSTKSVIASYLAGLFDTDGTVNAGGWNLGSKSEELLCDVKLLLDLFGIRCTLYSHWNSAYGRFYYALQINRAAALVFHSEITGYMVCRRKIETFTKMSAAWSKTCDRRDNSARLTTDVVKTVERIRAPKPVYDLVVPETHSFAANGLINHNTGFYCLCYGAAFDTAYETITSAEDASGNLPFVGYTQRQVRAIIDRWMTRNPEIVSWWDKEVDLYRAQGFLSDPLFGYRCDFLDGEDRNKLVNFRAQSLLGAIVKKAAVQLADGPGAPLACGVFGHGTGLVLDGHDRLDAELPVFHERRYVEKGKDGKEKWQYGWCEKGCTCPLEKARLAMTEAMTQRVPGLDVQFQGEAKIVVGGWV